MKPVILLGGGGHGRVLLSLLRRLDLTIIGLVDPNRQIGSDYLGVKVLGDDGAVMSYASEQIELVNGIGSLPGDSRLRSALFAGFRQKGYRFKTLIDPTAYVSDDVQLAEGVQIFAGVIVQVGAKIAENCIINSGAIVEHDCRIGRHVHVAPGAVLSGGVEIADNVHIGTGATIIQGIKIGASSVIGAGAVVTTDIGERQTVFPPRGHIQALR